MKATLALLVFMVSYSSSIVLAQEITYHAEDKPLSVVLEDLRKQYGLHFSYPSQKIKQKLVTIDAQTLILEDFLYHLLRPFSLSYQFVDDNFVVIKSISEIGLKIRAKVESNQDNSPLPYASIRVLGSYQGTYADQNGHFSLQIDNPDSTDLEIRFIGYEPIQVNVREFYEGGLDNIRLKPQKLLLEEITVVEYLNQSITIDPAQAFKIRLKPKETSILPGLPEADILYSLQMLPGIYSSDETASGINIRGSANDQTLVYWDRVPVYHTAHYFGLVSSITPSIIDQLDVFRSRIPIEYTGASAGIIDMRSTEEIPDKSSFEFGLNMTHANLYAKTPLFDRKLTLELASRRSYNDWIETPTFNSYENRLFDGSRLENILNIFANAFRTFNSKSLFRFWDHNFKALYQPHQRHKISLSYLTARNALDFSSSDLTESVQVEEGHKTNNQGFNFNWNANWSFGGESNISLSNTNYDLTQEFSFIRQVQERELEDFSRATNELDNWELRLNYSQNIGQNQRFDFGYQYNFIESLVEYREETVFEQDIRDIYNQEINIHTSFLNYFFQFNDKVFLNLGAKHSFYKEKDQHFLDPILNLNYVPHEDWQIKFSYGIYRQFLRTLRDVDINPSNATGNIWVLSDNDNIPLLQNNQVALGTVFNSKGWLIDVEMYFKKIKGLISSNYNTGVDNNQLDFTQGDGDIWGVDFLLKKRVKWYRTWLGYTYSVASNLFPDLEPNAFPSFLDIRHQLQWMNTFEIGQFEFSLSWNFRTGLPTTLPEGFNLITTIGDEAFYELVWGDINAERLPNYHRLDISIWYKFPKNPDLGWKGQLGFALLNAYDRKNLLNRSFYLDDLNEDDIPDIVSEQQFFIGLTPNLSLKFTF